MCVFVLRHKYDVEDIEYVKCGSDDSCLEL